MIQIGSKLRVIDNSGGRVALCLKILHKKQRAYAYPGDIVVLTVRRFRRAITVRKVGVGKIYTGVIVSVKKELNRKFGFTVKASLNSVVLLTKGLEPIGKRFRGVVFSDLRCKGFIRVLLIARILI